MKKIKEIVVNEKNLDKTLNKIVEIAHLNNFEIKDSYALADFLNKKSKFCILVFENDNDYRIIVLKWGEKINVKV